MVTTLASTMMACPPPLDEQEARFHEALGQVRGWRVENGLLHLRDAEGETVVRFRPET